jgi:aerobic carbon-monoxide dehydrogenase medium subunit
MKPAPFEYVAPASLDAALTALSERGEKASVLAGGQSLAPAMNLRLATPETLVDLNRIPGLDRAYVEGGELVVQALVRHRALEMPVTKDRLGPLLAGVTRYVGHLPIRVRGTFVGSIAHADPAAEWCTLATALDATIVVRSAGGERRLRAGDFFEGPFTTSLAPDEIVTEVRLPLLDGAGTGFAEKSRTAGDFATAAVVAVVRRARGEITEARIGVGGAEGRPVRAAAAERLLVGTEGGPDARAAAADAAAEGIDPISDAFCSADYRRHLVGVLTDRTLEAAIGGAT